MILYVDCIGGVAGDMLLGALLDAGATSTGSTGLGVEGLRLETGKAERHGIVATTVTVHGAPGQPHRHWTLDPRADRRRGLPERVTARAQAAFERLAHAEARIHGIAPEHVHFHEVGAVDAIGEVCGVALALESAWRRARRLLAAARRPRLRERRPRPAAAARAGHAEAARGRAALRRRRRAASSSRRPARRSSPALAESYGPLPRDDAVRHRLRRRHARPRGVPERRAGDPRHRGARRRARPCR